VDTRAERLRAIVLRTVPYGASDLVVHLLVRGRGRTSAFARGGKSSRKRFGGALEPFHSLDVLLAERPGQELAMLREAVIADAHSGLRDDLHRIAHAGYAAELVHELSRPGEPADELFALLTAFFERLSTAGAASARLRAFELGALGAAGLAPELSSCSRCGGPVAAGRAPLDPDAGGLACSRCSRSAALLLTSGARAALAQLQRSGLEGAEAPVSADGSGRPADLRAFEEAAAQAARPLAAFLTHHLGRPLRSAAFCAQVGAPP
jgi:DNA repair protein RecO (recombination protein O)